MHTEIETQQAELLAINDEIQSIQATAEAEARDLTSSEEVQVNRLFATFKAVENELQGQSRGRITTPEQPRQEMTSQQSTDISKTQRVPFAGRKMADLFGSAVNKPSGFKSNSEFLQAVANGLHHPGLVRNATMTEGTGADGGFTVPSQLISQIFDESLEMELIRPRARVFPMASNELNITSIDYTDHSSNIGGLDSKWFGEAETQTAQKAKFKQLTLRAKKLGIFTEASSEVVMDGMMFENVVIDAMAKSLSFDMDLAFIRGSGAGQPLGVLNAPATISVAKASGQAADTIVHENIVSMWSRLHPGLINDAIWICNPECLPQLLTMSFSGATDVPLFVPNNDASQATPGSIFGRPLFFSEKASALGDQGDLILVAPSMMAIGMRLDAAFDRSIHEGFMDDVVNFRLITRVEGTPIMNAAMTPRYGSNTLSFCSIIDDRG